MAAKRPWPRCSETLRDGTPCGTHVADPLGGDPTDRELCVYHAAKRREPLQEQADEGEALPLDHGEAPTTLREVPDVDSELVRAAYRGTPRDAIREFALANPHLVDAFLKGVLAAESDVWVSCKHCGKRSEVAVPNWHARTRAVEMLLEQGFGKAEPAPLEADEQLQAQIDLYLGQLSEERLMQIGEFMDFQKRFLARPMVEQMALSDATADEVATIACKHGYTAASYDR